jgi:hypothetical protein
MMVMVAALGRDRSRGGRRLAWKRGGMGRLRGDEEEVKID